MKQYTFTIVMLLVFGCQAEPPPPPAPVYLGAEIQKLSDELFACKKAENDRLRQQRDELRAEVDRRNAELDLLVASRSAKKAKP